MRLVCHDLVEKAGERVRVAIYCGSMLGKSEVYAEKAMELGKVLAHAGYGLVYGGANDGLMGKVADAALSIGGEVIGVMPEHGRLRERVHSSLTEIYYVQSMHERKQKMVDLADAFIAMPGGCGTLDEYFEVFTWAQIGLHDKKVILYNVDGFYDGLIMHFQKMMEQGFIREQHQSLLKVAVTLDEIFALLTEKQ